MLLKNNTSSLQNILNKVNSFKINDTEYSYIENLFVANRTNISGYENSKITFIGDGAFACCSKLTSISFPACETISNYAFMYCSSLTLASFSACGTVGVAAFSGCANLSSVNILNCTYIGNSAFAHCYNLSSISFPSTYIGNYAFYYCYKLSQLYLMGSSLCELYNSSAFYSTPFAGYSSYFSGTPYIYVPESLVTSYQNATNWTYFSSYFSAYEDNIT